VREPSKSKVDPVKDGPQRQLRLWPGVAIAALVILLRYAIPAVFPTARLIGALGGLAGGLGVAIWWAFFSRADRVERWGGVLFMIVALLLAPRILHESIATGGMGMLFPMFAVPLLALAFVAWAVATRALPTARRRSSMIAVILLACGGWAVVRTEGVTGDGKQQFRWRWGLTSEEKLLARSDLRSPTEVVPVATVDDGVAWPGFRGPRRDGVVVGVRIATDWSSSPPEELWRRPVGPGWSSFAVRGGLLYTQEQRGEEETVVCHDARSGEPVWQHRDPVRFSETMGGPGPRATPAVAGGTVYALGATGILNALDAADGSVKWSRDVAADAGVEPPYWGFSGSPLVVDDLVVVAASGRLVAYERASGEQRWSGPSGDESYSSPHLLTLHDVPQVVQLNGAGVISLSPADGTLLWEHAWMGSAIVQPAGLADGDVLIGALGVTSGIGVRRLGLTHGADGWVAEERWTSIGLKPYYNDFVVHDGHAYGFDGGILSCIGLDDGGRRWKGGRYGHGQLVVLADQGILLVVSEKGELALVEAAPGKFTELARFKAIEGKTWNHPVLVDDLLLVRNGREMAAWRLPPAER
jgi:outer membrane protein assembly factor BamB